MGFAKKGGGSCCAPCPRPPGGSTADPMLWRHTTDREGGSCWGHLPTPLLFASLPPSSPPYSVLPLIEGSRLVPLRTPPPSHCLGAWWRGIRSQKSEAKKKFMHMEPASNFWPLIFSWKISLMRLGGWVGRSAGVGHLTTVSAATWTREQEEYQEKNVQPLSNILADFSASPPLAAIVTITVTVEPELVQGRH